MHPTTQKNRPGPKGTSCLTCKRRHKRCDKRFPGCERCEKGGFKCLGYKHYSNGRTSAFFVEPAENNGPCPDSEPELQRQEPGEFLLLARCSEEDVVATTSAPEYPYFLNKPSSSTTRSRSLRDGHNTTSIVDRGKAPAQSKLTVHVASNFIPNLEVDSQSWMDQDNELHSAIWLTSNLTNGPTSTLRKLANLYTQFPNPCLDPLKAFMSNPTFDGYILEQYNKLMEKWYFKTVDNHKHFQQWLSSRLQSSPTSGVRWVALLELGIFEAILTGDASQRRFYYLLVGHIQDFLKHELPCTPSTEILSRRRDWIYVTLLKVMVDQTSYVYRALRSVTSVFLEIVFSNPILWPKGSNLTHVPLLNVLTLGSHEVAAFVLMDCACSMAFGLPQQIEYDTIAHSRQPSPSHQWAHGFPIDFQAILSDINSCRDKSPTMRDWREIEHLLLIWQSQLGEHAFIESWMTIAWYAIQESWRLALLIYLYMAVCDLSSDDLRIQCYVKQLLQVVKTVRKYESSRAEISFLIQYLMAGICARNEMHRKVVRDVLAETTEPKFWFIRGSDFVPVLDHLWHGAAANGRPVKWSDYMRSREAMLAVVT